MNAELQAQVDKFEQELISRFGRPLKVVVIERSNLKSVHAIASICAAVGCTTVEVLQSKNKKAPVAMIRQIAMYLCREYTTASLVFIGNFFNRDHRTVIHSINVVKNMLHIKDEATITLLRICNKIINENGI